MPLIPFLLLLSFSCFHISLCFLIFVFSSLFVAAYGASHCCWFESKLNWKPVCVSVRVTLKHWLISYCPGDKFAFLSCKLGERFVMFSEVICNLCFFRGGGGGKQQPSYARTADTGSLPRDLVRRIWQMIWSASLAKFNQQLTLAPRLGGSHVRVHMCRHVYIVDKARGRPLNQRKQIFPPFLFKSKQLLRRQSGVYTEWRETRVRTTAAVFFSCLNNFWLCESNISQM